MKEFDYVIIGGGISLPKTPKPRLYEITCLTENGELIIVIINFVRLYLLVGAS